MSDLAVRSSRFARAIDDITTGAPVDALTIDSLVVEYQHRTRLAVHTETALHAVSVRVDRGRMVAIVGESGSGKTTLLKSALGILPPNARIVDGAVRLGGVDITRWTDRELSKIRGRDIGYVPQDPSSSLNYSKKIARQVGEAILFHRRIGGAELREVVEDKLRVAGLSTPSAVVDKYPHELSGGMKQRVLIAIALASDPSFIVADEPTSALDVTLQKQLLDHFDVLRDQMGVGILLVTHDLGVALDRADEITVLREGRVVDNATRQNLVSAPRASYTRALLDAVPRLDTRKDSSANPAPVCSGPFKEDKAGPAFLSVHDVGMSYPSPGGETPVEVLRDISFTLKQRETLAVVGESGAGKSTLAQIIVGLTRQTHGRILFNGRDTSEFTRDEMARFRREVQFVYQNPDRSLDPLLKARDLIAEPLLANRMHPTRKIIAERVVELAKSVSLSEELLDRRPDRLSGGQKQRVAIARALALEPRLLILDEAVSALDVIVQASILDLLRRLQQELGISMLFITHDLGVVSSFADRALILRHGRIAHDETVAQLFDGDRDTYLSELIDAIPGASLREQAAQLTVS